MKITEIQKQIDDLIDELDHIKGNLDFAYGDKQMFDDSVEELENQSGTIQTIIDSLKTESWCFTFGADHRTDQGYSLGNCYVVIEGSFDEAREKLFDVRGNKWSMQYEFIGFREQIQKYNLFEITLDEIGLPKGMR